MRDVRTRCGRALSVRRTALRALGVATFVLALPLGCDRNGFDEPMTLGGQTVSAEVLNQGAGLYRTQCQSCHGHDGRGRVAGVVPPPRDLTLGVFKFTSGLADSLPTDADLMRTIRRGLADTPMQPFGHLSDEQVLSLAQLVKTFSDRWQNDYPGLPVPVPDDPWAESERQAALERGETVYHTVGECARCHPVYSGDQEVPRWEPSLVQVAGNEIQVPGFREDLSRPVEVDTVYGRVLSPDFLDDRPRAGSTSRDLYRVVAAGVGGTPMRGLHERLPGRDIWAVVHYLDSLLVLRGTDEAEALREQLALGHGTPPEVAREVEP